MLIRASTTSDKRVQSPTFFSVAWANSRAGPGSGCKQTAPPRSYAAPNDPAANLKWFEKVRLELDRWMNPAAAVRSTRKTGHFDIVFG
jgi:hypothetical protein